MAQIKRCGVTAKNKRNAYVQMIYELGDLKMGTRQGWFPDSLRLKWDGSKNVSPDSLPNAGDDLDRQRPAALVSEDGTGIRASIESIFADLLGGVAG